MKIIDTYKAGRYVSLILSEKLPFKPFNKVSVDGLIYTAVLVYEAKNEIAIIYDGKSDFKGKEISFFRISTSTPQRCRKRIFYVINIV